ncbi:hypothetical protein QAD02_023696 [Eretmocerus hayati]|uniref:Uncharacterized protein n=1 Tax=Eretmocerus hayati TaxID=131215 RepID=A0ACC2PY88_9HYME|nr:hypothetical protein QAD02_023696 [Eretmocerus hayati]
MDSNSADKCIVCHVSVKHKKRSDYVITEEGTKCRVCYRKSTRKPRSQESCPRDTESVHKKLRFEEPEYLEISNEDNNAHGESSRDVQDIQAPDPIFEKNDSITLAIKRTISSGSRCIFRCKDPEELRVIPESIRAEIWSVTGIYACKISKCCLKHFTADLSSIPDLEVRSLVSESDFTTVSKTELVTFLNSLRKPSTLHLDESYFEKIDDQKLEQHTGLRRESFESLLTYVHVKSHRKSSLILGMYLWKLRSGHTDELIASLFGIPRSTLERYFLNVRSSLLSYFVPLFLCANREIVRENQTPLARQLFLNDNPDGLLTIWDCTYVYLQKSFNYSFQRISYSGHKSRNLFKPMMIVTSNGYIVKVHGPHRADQSDAEITVEIMKCDWFGGLYQLGDVFVVDKGFAKSLPELEKEGYRAYMPSFIDKDKKQLTTAQANASRKVTKARYIVEGVNGRIKQSFKYFNDVWSNKSLGHAWDDFQIACAIYNAFFPRYESDKGYADIIYQEMMRRDSDTNILQVITEDLGFVRKRSIFETMSSDTLPEFPRYTMKDLYFISLGSYQLKQAISYYSEHIKTDGKYIFQVCTEIDRIDFDKYDISLEDPLLIKIRIQSRHSGNTKYCLFILTESENTGSRPCIQGSTTNENVIVSAQAPVSRDPSSITSSLLYYCQCKNGARTIGCCAHVMSVLWFLGYARYVPNISPPAQFLDKFFFEFPAITDGEEDSSDEDS